jgi:O-antigen ligase
MYKEQKAVTFIETNKPIIWGLFLSTIIFKFAIANIFLAFLLIFFFIQIIHSKKINFQRSFFPLILYFFWGALSLIWTTDILNTLNGIEATIPFLIFPLLISQYSDFETNDLSKTIRVFSICLLLYFIISLVNASALFLKDHRFNHFFYHGLTSVFNNNAIYISLAVAICILINFNLPKKTIKDYIILMLLGVFLLLLSSKNIIITTFLLIVFSLFLNKKNIKYTLITFFIFLLLFTFIVLIDNPIKVRFLKELNINLNYVLYGQDFYNYRFSGFEVRFFQWRMMFEMIINNQIGFLGLGLNNVNYLLNQYFSYYNLYKGYFYLNFHNQYLQTLGELGFAGLMLLVTTFIISIYNAIKNNNVYKIIIFTLFLSAFFTESFLCRQKGVFLFTTIFCLMYKFSESKSGNEIKKML